MRPEIPSTAASSAGDAVTRTDETTRASPTARSHRQITRHDPIRPLLVSAELLIEEPRFIGQLVLVVVTTDETMELEQPAAVLDRLYER